MADNSKALAWVALPTKERFALVKEDIDKARYVLASLQYSPAMIERHTRTALNELARNPKLLKCELLSITRSFVQAAELQLEIGSTLGEAFIVPFWSSKRGGDEAKLITGYKGLAKLMRESPGVRGVDSCLVREGDHFIEHRGSDPKIEHIVKSTSKSPITHAYAMVWREGAPPLAKVMDADELNDVRDTALAKMRGPNAAYLRKESPWSKHFARMCEKSPIRLAANHVTLSARLARALEIEEGNVTYDGATADRASGNEALKRKLQNDIPDAEVIAEEIDDEGQADS